MQVLHDEYSVQSCPLFLTLFPSNFQSHALCCSSSSFGFIAEQTSCRMYISTFIPASAQPYNHLLTSIKVSRVLRVSLTPPWTLLIDIAVLVVSFPEQTQSAMLIPSLSPLLIHTLLLRSCQMMVELTISQVARSW